MHTCICFLEFLTQGERRSVAKKGQTKTEGQKYWKTCNEWVRMKKSQWCYTVSAWVYLSDMAISWNRCPWTQVCANRYLSLTDHPSTGNYTVRSTAGVTGLSRIYINLHVSLGLAAASGTPDESCSHSADSPPPPQNKNLKSIHTSDFSDSECTK